MKADPTSTYPPAAGTSGGAGEGSCKTCNGQDKDPGMITLVSYLRNSDGSLDRQGSVRVTLAATGHSFSDQPHGCKPNVATTDSKKKFSGNKTNLNYGMAHLTNCWVGDEGTHTYSIVDLRVPSGFSFRSMHADGKNYPAGVYKNQTFNVKSNDSTTVSIWLNKGASSSSDTDPSKLPSSPPGNDVENRSVCVAFGPSTTNALAAAFLDGHIKTAGKDNTAMAWKDSSWL
jgi:hypothetical protein